MVVKLSALGASSPFPPGKFNNYYYLLFININERHYSAKYKSKAHTNTANATAILLTARTMD
jgi:hypothetical protein